MDKKFTVAAIGCGAIAQALHLPGYARRADVGRIIGVDPDAAQRAEVTAKYPDIVTYTDYREMFAQEKPDFVSVCTPNVFHAEHAIAALQAGAHLLLEKPMTMTVAEAELVRAAATAADKQVMIGFSHRLIRSNQQIKQILAEGIIGAPFMIRVRFAHSGPFPGWARTDWFYRPEMAGGGALFDMGIHAIDLCQWLLGPITSVTSQMATLRKDIPLDDNAVLALEFGGQALGYIEVGWTSGPGFGGVEIYADNGSIINNYTDPLRVCTGKASADINAEPEYEWVKYEKDGAPESWAVEMDYFMDTILRGEKPAMDIDAGITALNVALNAVAAARDGRRRAEGAIAGSSLGDRLPNTP